MIPHLVFRPNTLFPFTWCSLSVPTTAKGMLSWKRNVSLVISLKKTLWQQVNSMKYLLLLLLLWLFWLFDLSCITAEMIKHLFWQPTCAKGLHCPEIRSIHINCNSTSSGLFECIEFIPWFCRWGYAPLGLHHTLSGDKHECHWMSSLALSAKKKNQTLNKDQQIRLDASSYRLLVKVTGWL